MRHSPSTRNAAFRSTRLAVCIAVVVSSTLIAGAQAASFTLSANPISQSACFGDLIDVQVRVRTGDGYNFPVKVTYPNLPNGFFLLASAPNPVTPGPSGNVQTRLTKTGGAQGPVDLTIRGTGSNGQTAQAAVIVDVQAIPGAPVPRQPENGFSTSTTPTLEWTGSMYADRFIVQVSTDTSFAATSIAFEAVVTDQPANQVTVTSGLAIGQLYYWRVYGVNECGDGFQSPVFSFVTDGMCAPLDVAIPDGSGSVHGDVVLPSGAALADVDIQVVSDHPQAGNLDLQVTHLDQTVQLLGASGCTAPDVAARFDDAAASAAAGTCSSTGNAIGGSLRPAQPLAAFNGQPGNGTWRVTARDTLANGVAGRLRGVCVQTRATPESGALFASSME